MVLLHSASSSLRVTSEAVDIMLSPALYTLKREPLEIKYQYQAKKVAPSVLDELLGEGEYKYSAFKDDEGWVFIAYSPNDITQLLEQLDIEASSVENIYFAQQSVEMFENPIAIDSTMALGVVNDIVTVMPKALYGERRFLNLDESFRPSSGGVSLYVESKRSSIAKNDAIILASIFTLLGSIFFVEGVEYSLAKSKQSGAIDELLVDHPSLQSKYSRESIAKKYQKRDKQERNKREFLKEVSSVVRYGGKVKEISFEGSKLKAKLEVTNKNSYNMLNKSIKIKQIDSKNIELEGGA